MECDGCGNIVPQERLLATEGLDSFGLCVECASDPAVERKLKRFMIINGNSKFGKQSKLGNESNILREDEFETLMSTGYGKQMRWGRNRRHRKRVERKKLDKIQKEQAQRARRRDSNSK